MLGLQHSFLLRFSFSTTLSDSFLDENIGFSSWHPETKICYLDPKMRQTELEAIIKSAVIMGV